MSKERLEEIAYNVDISLDGEKALMSIGDYDFLYNYALQQAERVEEYRSNLEHGAMVAVKTAVKLHHQQQENKRYREALKNIYELAEYNEYDNTLEQIVSEVEKALEGEK